MKRFLRSLVTRLLLYLHWIIVLSAFIFALAFVLHGIDTVVFLSAIGIFVGLLPLAVNYRQSLFQERLIQLLTQVTPFQLRLLKTVYKAKEINLDTLSKKTRSNRADLLGEINTLKDRKLIVSNFVDGKAVYTLTNQGLMTVDSFFLSGVPDSPREKDGT